MSVSFRPFDYRLLVILAVAGVLLGARTNQLRNHDVAPARDGGDVEAAVKRNIAALLMAERGARVLDPERDIVAVSPGGDASSLVGRLLQRRLFAALAVPAGGHARDLFRLEVRVAPNGAAYDPAWVVNLTQSLHADDSALSARGARVATAARYGGLVAAFEVRDFRGEDPVASGVSEWGTWQRTGDRVTNLERTGQMRGVALQHFTIDTMPAPAEIELELLDDELVARDPGGEVVSRIRLEDAEVTGKLALTRLPTERKMPMEPLNWLADRGRGFAQQGLAPAWLGIGIELMKEFYFEAKEAKATMEEMAFVPDEEDTVQNTPQIREAAKVAYEEAVELAKVQAGKTRFPWPPAPLEPMLQGDTRPGEGIWVPVGEDRVDARPNAPPLFYQTFLYPTPRYRKKAVYVIAWDPAQVGMSMRAGTREPIPMTAHRGDGRIPRRKEHIEQVVAGFNGGFQTTHIWYGMMVDRKVLLPPRRFGATIALMEDGRTAMGSWRPGARVPPDMVSYRQNLPPIVQDGVFNPYNRSRWGGHVNVAGAKDGWTVRSAVCTMKPGYMLYFYADYADQHTVADILLHAGCDYGVHLDMNYGHTGFELYRQLAADEEPAHEEAVREVMGIRFQGSLLCDRVRHMNRPRRYLGVDYRDFFYLHKLPVVPGADLQPPSGTAGRPGEGRWLISELPHNAALPPRLAWTWLESHPGRLEVLQIDPRAARFELAPASRTKEARSTEDFDRDGLVLSIPADGRPGPEPTVIEVGEALLIGVSPSSVKAPGEPSTGTLAGTDPNGFFWAVRVLGASLRDGLVVLARRGVERPIWIPTEAGPPVWFYQPAPGGRGLIELLAGDSQGAVVDGPMAETARLRVYAAQRPERVVRLFPEMTKNRGATLKTTRGVRPKHLESPPAGTPEPADGRSP